MGPARRSSMQSTCVVSNPPSLGRYRNRTIRSLPFTSRISGLYVDGVTVHPSGVLKVKAPDGWVCARGSGGGGGSFFFPAQAMPGHRSATATIAEAKILGNLLEGR